MNCPFCQIINQLSSSPLFVQLFKSDPSSPFRLCKHSKMPGVRDRDMPDLNDIPLPPLPPLPPDDGLGPYIPPVQPAQQDLELQDSVGFDEVDQPGQPEMPAQPTAEAPEMEPVPGPSSGLAASAPINIPTVSGTSEWNSGEGRYTRAQLRTVLDETLEAGPPYEFEAEVQFPVTYQPGGLRPSNGPKSRSVYPKVRVMPIDSDDDDKDENLPTVVRAHYDAETNNAEIGWNRSLSEAMRRADEADQSSVSDSDDEDGHEDDTEDTPDDRGDADMMDGDVQQGSQNGELDTVQNRELDTDQNGELDTDQNRELDAVQNDDLDNIQNDGLDPVQNGGDAGAQGDHQPDDQGHEQVEDQDFFQARDSPSPSSVNGYSFDIFYSDDGEEADEEDVDP